MGLTGPPLVCTGRAYLAVGDALLALIGWDAESAMLL
jgi:hypothetical protein